MTQFNDLKPSYNKDGPYTKEKQSPGTKQVDCEYLQLGQASDVGTAPPSRVYTRDYSKTRPEADDSDTVSPFLGNPLGL